MQRLTALRRAALRPSPLPFASTLTPSRVTSVLSPFLSSSPFALPPRRWMSIASLHSMSELRDVVEAATAADKLAVLEWKATWCGKCKTLAKELERLAEEHPDVEFRYADIEEGDLKEGKKEAGIDHLPVLHFIKGGELVHQIVGVRINETAKTIERYSSGRGGGPEGKPQQPQPTTPPTSASPTPTA